MVMSIALVAVLVAAAPPRHVERELVPRLSPTTQLGVSLEERRAEAAYLKNIRMGTFPTKQPASRPVLTFPRKYPDDSVRESEGGAPGPTERQAAGGYLTPMGSMPIVPGAQEPTLTVALAHPLTTGPSACPDPG
jgi:hypothetical protein